MPETWLWCSKSERQELELDKILHLGVLELTLLRRTREQVEWLENVSQVRGCDVLEATGQVRQRCP
jgi:hypothetical protein